MPKGKENIFFIKKYQIPKDKKVTYINPVCDHRKSKPEPWRVRIVVGGNKLPYFHDAGSPAACHMNAKLIFNSTI